MAEARIIFKDDADGGYTMTVEFVPEVVRGTTKLSPAQSVGWTLAQGLAGSLFGDSAWKAIGEMVELADGFEDEESP